MRVGARRRLAARWPVGRSRDCVPANGPRWECDEITHAGPTLNNDGQTYPHALPKQIQALSEGDNFGA